MVALLEASLAIDNQRGACLIVHLSNMHGMAAGTDATGNGTNKDS